MTGGQLLQAVLTGLSLGAIYGLVAIGFSLVWSLTRVLPFAHGDIVVGSALFAVLAIVGTTPVAISPSVGRSIGLVVLTLIFGVLLSVASYAVAVRPVLDRGGGAADVLGWVAGGMTAGLAIRTALALALSAVAYAVPDPLHFDAFTSTGSLALPGGGTVQVRVFPVIAVGLLAAGVVDRFLVRARLGRAMRSIADDADAAVLCGVPVERAVVAAFAVAGLLAGVAALLAAPVGTIGVDYGAVLGLAGAAAALLGRLGSPRGAVVGGLVLGVAQQLVQVAPSLGAAWSELVPLAVLVVVVAVRPGGLRAPRQVAVE